MFNFMFPVLQLVLSPKNPEAPVFGPHLHQFLVLWAEVWDKPGSAVNEVDLFFSRPDYSSTQSEPMHKCMQRTKTIQSLGRN